MPIELQVIGLILIIFAPKAIVTYFEWKGGRTNSLPSRFTQTNYIQSAKARGLTTEQIESEMRVMGWIQ